METARPRVPLKHSTYILISCADTRKRKERGACAGEVVSRGSALFGKQEALQRGGARKRYEELISQNELPFACDIVDEMLTQAYSCTDVDAIRAAIERIVDTCRGTKDRYLARVSCLAEGHRGGIVVHARHQISSGKVEGTNQMIKTLRRAG
ncbi:transposase [Atopobium sp. oral taxon 416]|uniref:transposase n=1 Tax=Atopobium sp. oral taxon 416 TaxID=712157 RepID=UPI001BA6E4FC|nr:transposase [Atopobium sp. oral taxon 416]QUC02765.1 transposase [Atopobium sp. oral taxon 416]